jgi:hypothetical protein
MIGLVYTGLHIRSRLSAIMLGRMEMSVQEALNQYDVVGNQVFGKPRLFHSRVGAFNFLRPKFPSRNMKNALIDVIGIGLEMEIKQLKQPAGDIAFQGDEERCRT